MYDLLTGCFLKISAQGRISRLGKHIKLNNKRFIKFSVAYNILKHVEYINYVAYDKQADYIEKYAKIGTFLYVESAPYTNRYLDKKSEQEKYISKTIHRVESLSFIGNIKHINDNDLSLEEIKEYQQQANNIDAITIAKNLLKDAGYEIIKGENCE